MPEIPVFTEGWKIRNPRLHNELQARLGYTRPCLKTKQQNEVTHPSVPHGSLTSLCSLICSVILPLGTFFVPSWHLQYRTNFQGGSAVFLPLAFLLAPYSFWLSSGPTSFRKPPESFGGSTSLCADSPECPFPQPLACVGTSNDAQGSGQD